MSGEKAKRSARFRAGEGVAWKRKLLGFIGALGPGFISGASDDVPTTVATLAVLGATTIYGLSWLTILIYPLLASIQIISAQVGVVTEDGLQSIVRRTHGHRWGLVLLISVLAVNLVTISADLQAGAASLGLIFGVSWQWFILPFGLGMLALLIFGSYQALERVLRFVLLVFVSYIASTFLAHPNWGTVFHQTLHPPISLNRTYIEGMLALLGTTLTSYAYVWESIEEAEERPPISSLGLARADAGVGMLFAVAIFWFILIGTGATLGVNHLPVETAQDAARALTPVAGALASDLFALGLLASAILAVPVLAATTAYMMGQEFGWPCGLSNRVERAGRFYLVVAVTILFAIVVSFLGISPIRLLFISSIVGGIGTPISLAFLLRVAGNRRIMGERPIGTLLSVVGWGTAVVIGATSVYFLWQQLGSLF
jgi:Mn2+/Fe2+ NRAMP family transporter